jgi:hypothetical protein
MVGWGGGGGCTVKKNREGAGQVRQTDKEQLKYVSGEVGSALARQHLTYEPAFFLENRTLCTSRGIVYTVCQVTLPTKPPFIQTAAPPRGQRMLSHRRSTSDMSS